MRSSFALGPSRTSPELRRRVDFFFHDYVDPLSVILEVGPAETALEPYLKEAGFHAYTRLDRVAPADVVGELSDWRALGLEEERYDLVIVFDLPSWSEGDAACLALLKPGGCLFAGAARAGALARFAAAVGLGSASSDRRRGTPVDLATLPGFLPLAVRRDGLAAQWARLRKPLGREPHA